MFDPQKEFTQAVKWVDDFLANHRIDPYTPDEIKEIMRPLPKPLTPMVNEIKIVASEGVPRDCAIAISRGEAQLIRFIGMPKRKE
jgi:hypothetical protein